MSTSRPAILALASLTLFGLAAVSPAQAQNSYITNFAKTDNIFTNLNQQYPTTGPGVPGSGMGVPNASFLFNPATYTSPNAVSGANKTTNGVSFLLTSDASGRDFAEIGGTPLTVTTNLFGVTSISTLTNSFFNANENVTFTGSGGATQTFTAVQLHDFNGQGAPINNSFAFNGSATPNFFDQTAFQVVDTGAGGSGNSSNGAFGTYGLDEQTFLLSSVFASQTLQSITFTNNGGGTPLLLGITATPGGIPPVPEASTTVSLGLLLALAGMAAVIRRKRQVNCGQ